MIQTDVVIIGGGAAGLMCAATAGKRGRKVDVLDHANKIGKKILMSGGGRCNFTNMYTEASNFLSENPHFCKSALSRYTQYDFMALVAEYDLVYHEKKLGQLFCDNKAQDILDILLSECEKAKVSITTYCDIQTVEKSEKGFILHSSKGDYECENLVVATGGPSIPTMGATGLGYSLAKQFELQVTDIQASLVPFTLSGSWLDVAKALSGLSLDTVIQCGDTHFKEALLFTHRGLSGPAVLQISNYWNVKDTITVDFSPELSIVELLQQAKENKSKKELKTILAEHLPKRFVLAWLESLEVKLADKKALSLSQTEINILEQHFHAWQIVPSGTEGWRTAEVARGGVNTDEISSKTFASKKQPNLYFIGEVLDVTGWLGGFNFQWAWSSAWCAGQYV